MAQRREEGERIRGRENNGNIKREVDSWMIRRRKRREDVERRQEKRNERKSEERE